MPTTESYRILLSPLYGQLHLQPLISLHWFVLHPYTLAFSVITINIYLSNLPLSISFSFSQLTLQKFPWSTLYTFLNNLYLQMTVSSWIIPCVIVVMHLSFPYVIKTAHFYYFNFNTSDIYLFFGLGQKILSF